MFWQSVARCCNGTVTKPSTSKRGDGIVLYMLCSRKKYNEICLLVFRRALADVGMVVMLTLHRPPGVMAYCSTLFASRMVTNACARPGKALGDT